MAEAVVLYGGKVKQATNLSSVTSNNKTGFVTGFVLNGIKYTHTFTQNYVDTSAAGTVSAGYYSEPEFLKYLVQALPVSNLVVFDLRKIADAVKGDTVKIFKLKVTAPYSDFCTLNEYSWSYDPSVKITDDAGDIVIPAITPSPVTVTLLPPANAFYNKNILLITSSDFTENRDSAAYALASVALQIYRINKDIFPLFNQSPELAAYITAQNNEWATGIIFNQPTLEDITQYQESLTNYYNTAYSNQLLIATSLSTTKLFWLAIVLSASGLAVLPIDLKLSLLKQIVDILNTNFSEDKPYSPLRDIVSDGPGIILKIVESVSVTPTQTDYFLNQLLNIKYSNAFVVDQTLFEALYNMLGDNRIGKYTFGAINTGNNRKQYIQFLYTSWKTSKFYPRYNSPDYSQPAKPNGVFPESYFIANKTKYYYADTAPATLIYRSVSTTLTSFVVNFKFEFVNGAVKVSKVITDSINDEHPSSETSTIDYGTYHPYQQLSLIGYTMDPMVHVPSTNSLPAFYLKYAYDAQSIDNFDIGILNFTQLAFSILFNFAGIEAGIAELAYLTEISDAAEAASLPATQALLRWPTFLGISKIVIFSAGSFTAIVGYINDQKQNPNTDVQNFIQTLNIFLNILTLGALNIDVIGQLPVANTAKEVIVANAALNETDQLSAQVMIEIDTLGDISDLVDLMNQKLNTLPNIPQGQNTISVKFATITEPPEQLNFFNQFYFIQDDDPLWLQFNTEYTPYTDANIPPRVARTQIDDWIEIVKLKNDRVSIDFLNAYRDFKYVDPYPFKHVWELKGINGGHRVINVTTNLSDSSTLWKIVPDSPDINSTIPLDKRTIITDVNTHKFYNNLWRYNADVDINKPDAKLLNGLGVSRKPGHFVLDDTWLEQDLYEEMALAFKNKTFINKIPSTYKYNGTSIPITISFYESAFSDGTKLEIRISSEAVDLEGNRKTNYVSLFAIQDPNK